MTDDDAPEITEHYVGMLRGMRVTSRVTGTPEAWVERPAPPTLEVTPNLTLYRVDKAVADEWAGDYD